MHRAGHVLFAALLLATVFHTACGASYVVNGIASLAADGSALKGQVAARMTQSAFFVRNDTDDVGRYWLELPEGMYNLGVTFSTPGFFCSNFDVIEGFNVHDDRYTDLRVETVTVSGYVRDDITGDPLSNVSVSGQAFSRSGFGGFDTLDIWTDAAGRYHAVVVENEYSVVLTPDPSDRPVYTATSAILNAVPPSTQADLFLQRSYNITCKLVLDWAHADTVAVHGILVVEQDNQRLAEKQLRNISIGTEFTLEVPSGGVYSAYLEGELGNSDFRLTSSGIYAGEVDGTGNTTSTQLLTIHAYNVTMEVRADTEDRVPGVSVAGSTFSYSPFGGFDQFFFTSTDKPTAVLVPINDFDVVLTPPSGSSYALSVIVGELVQNQTRYYLENAVGLSGVVRYEDGSAADGELRFVVEGKVAARGALGPGGSFSVQLGDQSLYDLECTVDFTSSDFSFHSDGAWLGDGHSWDWAPAHAFGIDTVAAVGLVLGEQDGEKAPIANATVSMTAFSERGGFDRFEAVTDEAGIFYGRVLPNFYFDVVVRPPQGLPFTIAPQDDVAMWQDVNKVLFVLTA